MSDAMHHRAAQSLAFSSPAVARGRQSGGQIMKRYYAVEVTRTVTDRRTIIVSAEDSATAHDVAVESAESERIRAPWVNPRTTYSTDQTTQLDRPEYVDVTVNG